MNLEKENEDLKKLLAEKEQDVVLAGKYGCELLEKNDSLSGKLEKLSGEYASKIKELEQENYSFAQKLGLKKNAEHSQNSEIERLDGEVSQLVQERNELLIEDTNKKKFIDNLQNKILELEKDLDILSVNNRNLEQELCLNKERLNEFKTAITAPSDDFKHDRDGDEIESKINELIVQKQTLHDELDVYKKEVDNANVKLECVKNQHLMTEQELEEKECQITSYINAIEKIRVEKLDVQAEMDAMRMGGFVPNEHGNSLFAEVEDNRVKVQKKMIDLRISCKTLKNKNELYSQQNLKLKNQMLSMSGNKENPEYVKKLESFLAQSRVEIEELNRKLCEVEKSSKKAHNNNDVNISNGRSKDEVYAHDYVKLMLSKSREEVEELKKELESVRFMKTAESHELLKCEQKLNTTEKIMSNCKTEIMELKLKIEELSKEKETTKKVPNQVKEKIPDFQPSMCEQKTRKCDILQDINFKEEEIIGKVPGKKNHLPVVKKEAKKSVRISVDEPDTIEVKENQSEVKTKGKGRVANVPTVDYKEAKMECKQQ